jgi:hypothetical protein
MKKRIQRLVVSSLFVLSLATVCVTISQVVSGTLYGNVPPCPSCDEQRGCAGSPPDRCTCPALATKCTNP